MQVKEFKDTIIFLRSISKGVGDKSYGIHVGKMAGLPSSVTTRAYQILDEYLQFSNQQKGSIDSVTKKDSREDEILISKLKNTLKSIDINKTAPIEALSILDRLKKENEL